MAAFKTRKTSISACKHDRNEIPTAITMFSRSSSPIGQSVLLENLTESMKSKLASFKPEVLISQLVDNIGAKFQRLYTRVFRGRATRRDKWPYYPMSGYVGNQRWRPITGSRNDITQIWASMHDRNEIPTAISMFSGSGNKTRLLQRLPDVWICIRNRRWRILTSG